MTNSTYIRKIGTLELILAALDSMVTVEEINDCINYPDWVNLVGGLNLPEIKGSDIEAFAAFMVA